ncbi:MAG: DUF2723 domain-containing protein [Elusimicrobiota bacterium]
MIITFFVSFGIYLITSCPTVYSGDSGELTTACNVLGIAHPPGYPLYVLLGKIFTVVIPFGNIAYRINLMSTFFGALTCGVVYLILQKMVDGKRETVDGKPFTFYLLPSTAAFCLAFSNPLWSQSTIAEVYTLNAFFVALLIYLFLHPTPYTLHPAFLFGLGLGDHHTLVLLIPGIVYWIVKNMRYEIRDKSKKSSLISNLLSLICFFLLGFSVYLYLLLRSQQNPIADWDNPENLTNFFRVVFRTGYGGVLHLEEKGGFLSRPMSLFIQQILEFIRNFIKSFTIFGFLVGILGIFVNYKQAKKSFWFLVLVFSFVGPFFIFLANKPVDIYTRDLLEPFYIPSTLVFTIWLGSGIIFIVKKTRFSYLLILAILVFQLRTNFAENNLRNNFLSFDFGKNILNTVKNNSLLFLDKADESVFILAYQKIVENRKPLVKIYDCNASVFPNIYGDRYFWIKGKERTAVRLPVERKMILESKKNVYYHAGNLNYFADMKFSKTGLLYLLTEKLPPILVEDIYVLRQQNLRHRDKIIAYSFYVSIGDYYLETNRPNSANTMYEKANKIFTELK